MNFSLKNYYPYIAAIAAFVVLTLVYFRPLLSGKELSQHDITQHRGMSKEIADHREKYHEEPLWTNSMFGGMPAYQISTLYPGNLLTTLDKAVKLFLPHPSGYMFLCFAGFFILLLCLEIEPWLALVGALAYGLSSYYIICIGGGHNSKANAMGYLPAMLGGIILLFKGRYWIGSAVTLLFMALELNANHVQISYYGFVLVGIMILFWLYYAVKEKTLPSFFKSLGILVVIAIISVLPNAGNLMCTEEYGKYSSRGPTELTIDETLKSNSAKVTSGLDKDYATQWSYGIGETFSILIPDFKGGANAYIGTAAPDALKKVDPNYREQVARMDAYFGDQPSVGGPVYIGAIIIFLTILGLFIVKNRLKWPLLAGTILFIALSWGHNFMGLTEFFMDHFPGYNKFRAVSMCLVIAELCIPVLAIMAVNELLKMKSLQDKIKVFKKEIEIKKLLFITIGVVGGFCLVGFLAPDVVNSFQGATEEQEMVYRFSQGGQGSESEIRQYVGELMPQIEKARKAMFTSDAMRSLIFLVLAFLFIYLFLNKKIKKEMLFAALGIFILIDLWTVDTRYLSEKSFIPKSANVIEKTTTDEEILKDPALDYRVLNLAKSFAQDATTSYWHKSIGGYHGAKLKKYQEIIDFHLVKSSGGGEINTFYAGIGQTVGNDSLLSVLMGKLNVLNMLNTKYFIMALREGQTIPLMNKQANGNAWFVKSVKTVMNADSEIVGLYSINTKTEAITQEKFKNDLKYSPSYPGEGTIKMTAYKANHLEYESDSKNAEFAVFSEIYYPKGWNAYIDGNPVPHIGVNYILRGTEIPAGKHKIEFKFEPKVYKTGNTIAMAGSLLLFVSIGVCLFMERKISRKTENEKKVKTA
jgi:hypothetical protein